MMPTTIEYDPRKLVDVLLEDHNGRRLEAQTQHDHAGWWLVVGGVRKHGPFASIGYLRDWVRDHTEQLLSGVIGGA